MRKMKLIHWKWMVAAVVLVSGNLILGGCSTTSDSSRQQLSESELRRLYPRHYLENISPWDRNRAEYEIEGWKNSKK